MIVIDGVERTPRSLTLREFRGLSEYGDDQDGAMVGLACGVGVEVGIEWTFSQPVATAMAAIKECLAASGFGEDATKSGATADDAGAARASE